MWGLAQPAYADYVTASEKMLGLRPPSISHPEAATMPEVGLTSLFSLKRTALPGGGSSLVATRSRRCHHTKRRTRRLQG